MDTPSTTPNLHALQIGAGNIGRALLGDVLSEAGFHITFADVNETLVASLNQRKAYDIDIVSANGKEKRHIAGVDAISSLSEADMTHHIIAADIITTAVGVGILPHVAPALCRGIMTRIEHGVTKPLVVVACENVTRNTSVLHDEIMTRLPDDSWRARVRAAVSFPNCVVDRIVPNSPPTHNPLRVTTEAYSFIAIDKTALVADFPNIPGILLVDDLNDILAQKLFTFNGVHAAAAYLGFRRGCHTIADAATHPDIEPVLQAFLREVSTVVTSHYPSITPEQQDVFAHKTLLRIQNPYLNDSLARVGREPLRKLAPHDRLVAPAILAAKDGGTLTAICTAIAAALHYSNPDDPQAVELQRLIAQHGARKVIADITELPREHSIVTTVAELYKN